MNVDEVNARLKALGPAQLYVGPSYAAAVPRLRQVFQDAHMGLQVYLRRYGSLLFELSLELIF